VKYLIVNGDDFGATRGINRGIIEAHRCGILTSTSLLVNTQWSPEAAALRRALPELSVGLHVDLGNREREVKTGSSQLRAVLNEQLSRFQQLMGRMPTHLDSHHNVHRNPEFLPCFFELAQQRGLPLRDNSAVRHFSKFYGQWSGLRHLEQISVENLARMLERDIEDGVTELACHPGYVDLSDESSYSLEREAELRTLCDPRIRNALGRQSIQLISYHDVAKLLAVAAV
jgi:predicted glycoside hydrolase/deacetylase ChbG (UPF0249 family)